MDFDTNAVNLYFNLVKGDIDTPIKDLRFKQQFIEEKVRSGNNSVLPIDILLFSRHYNLAWAIELKDTTTTNLPDGQVQAYYNLAADSFRRTLPSHTELDRMKIEVTYQGNGTNGEHISNQLQICGASFPVLSLDMENCKLYKHSDTSVFADTRLANTFNNEVDLGIDSMAKLAQYVKFGPKTNHQIVAAAVLPTILKMTQKAHRRSGGTVRIELVIGDITKESYTTIDIWDKLDSTYRAQLTRSVRDALIALRDGGLGELEITAGEKVSLNIYDVSGKVNQQILSSITQRVNSAANAVGLSQSSWI
jgi:hypothetical protein